MPIRFVDARWSEIWREKDRKNNEEYNLDIWICGYIMVCIYIWYVWVCLNKHMWKTLKNRWCTINPLTKLHSFGYHHLSTHPYIRYNLDRKVICNFSLHVGGVLLIYFFLIGSLLSKKCMLIKATQIDNTCARCVWIRSDWNDSNRNRHGSILYIKLMYLVLCCAVPLPPLPPLPPIIYGDSP